jgi:hypothetical protein
MSPEAQRIAIAEACGFGGEFGKRWILEVGMEGEDKFAFAATRNNLDEEVPDYLNDLNAMHEAEKALTEDQYYAYCNKLSSSARKISGSVNDWNRATVSAAAAQRAEAFLRTLNLWEGGK